MGHRNLIIWQQAMELVERVYRLTQKFPAEERCDLTTQVRRASVSVPSNIAEGHARLSTKEYISFLSIARGSLLEVDTQLHKMLNASITTLRRKLSNP